MLKRLINWLAGVREIEDPNAYDLYPDILPSMSAEEVAMRIGSDPLDLAGEEESEENFWMEYHTNV